MSELFGLFILMAAILVLPVSVALVIKLDEWAYRKWARQTEDR